MLHTETGDTMVEITEGKLCVSHTLLHQYEMSVSDNPTTRSCCMGYEWWLYL